MSTTNKILTGAAAGLILLSAAGTVYAHGDRGPGRHGFGARGGHGMATRFLDRFDADKDGKITKGEVEAKRDGSLKKYDADGSAALSLKEFEGLWMEMTRHRMVRAFQRLDRNGDGQVTKDEMNRPLTFLFSRLDRNGDGAITRDEMRPRFKGHHRGHRGKRGEHRRGHDRERGERGER